MDPVLISTIAVAVIKGVIQILQMVGLTDEDIDKLLQESWQELKEKTPNKLPDA